MKMTMAIAAVMLTACAGSGVPWTAPVMTRRKQGDAHWHSLYVVPLFDDGKLAANSMNS